MLPVSPNLSKDQKTLLKLFKQLSVADKETVTALALFLSNRESGILGDDKQTLVEPKNIPRPEKESVVKAMRRLSENYEMLDKSSILDQASTLMSAHILQGRLAESVIDDLEVLFADAYAKQMSKL